MMTSLCNTKVRPTSTFPGVVLILSVLAAVTCCRAQLESDLVYYDSTDGTTLKYATDPATGHRIPDFSYAGYKTGEERIPDLPTAVTVSPGPGDDTQRIQDAVNAVSRMSPDKSGFRGAVLLDAGRYQVGGTIRISTSGIILRGAGDEDDPDTNSIIHAVGDTPHHRTVIRAGGGWQQWEDGRSDTTAITQSVRAGSRKLTISDTTGYSVGDEIVIYHPCTSRWIKAVNSGGVHAWHYRGWVERGDPWTCGDTIGEPYGSSRLDIVYKRRIADLTGGTLTVNAPVFNNLDPSLSPELHVYRHTGNGLARQIGIEYLRIHIEADGPADEDHAWDAIKLYGLDDGWVRGVTALNFVHAGVRTHAATNITVKDVRALDPASVIDSRRRYNFSIGGFSQLILVENSYARNGRHHFVAGGGASSSGIVFLRSTSERACSTSEGHRHWSQGLLFDNYREIEHLARTGHCGDDPSGEKGADWGIGLYNRGSWADHGWSTVYSVAWNSHIGNAKLSVQQPPTSQNFSIGSSYDGPQGDISGYGPFMALSSDHCTYESFANCAPAGYIEGTNRSETSPSSLYEAQLRDRGYPREERNITYVSDMTPRSTAADYRWKPMKDGAFGGGTITLHGEEYAKGLGVHAYTALTYELEGNYSRFKADIGLDDQKDNLTEPDRGTVVFEVYVDGELKYNSGTMRWWYPTRSVNLDVSEAGVLTLVVNDTGDSIRGDYASWANARLQRVNSE